jgi:hypothetical protein
MKPMLGLHRAAAAEASTAPPGQPPPGQPVVHPSGRVLEYRTKSRSACRFWASGAGCRMGEGCRFAHDGAPGRGSGVPPAKRPRLDE